MFNQLQQAYENGLKNLVFIDFSKKTSIGEVTKSELEFSLERACCEDIITAINWHLREGDYASMKERIITLQKSISKIERLENQKKEQHHIPFYEIASSLCERGYSAKVVKFNANQN